MRKIATELVVWGLLALAVGCNGQTGTTVAPTVAPTVANTPDGQVPTVDPAPAEGCWVAPTPITDRDYIRGEEAASITIIEYSDFQ